MPTTDTEPPDITTMSDEEMAKQLYIHAQSKRTKPAAWATLSDFQKDDWDNLADYVRTLFAPPATPPTRIPIAISSDYSGDTVICDDGTIWRRVPPLHINWTQLPPIPQPDASPEPPRNDVGRHHGSSGRIAATPDPLRDAVTELLKVMYHCSAYFSDQLARSEAAKTPPRVEHITMSNMCDRAIAKAEGRNP